MPALINQKDVPPGMQKGQHFLKIGGTPQHPV
jgi:hypothetical protein